MDCLVLPLSMLRRRPRPGYRLLTEEDAFEKSDDPVKVVVGKEKREFVVDPFVLEENPFQILIDILRKDKKARVDIDNAKRVIFVDVDSILFEHMLWLMMNNDCSSLLQLNLKEIVDFYAQDN